CGGRGCERGVWGGGGAAGAAPLAAHSGVAAGLVVPTFFRMEIFRKDPPRTRLSVENVGDAVTGNGLRRQAVPRVQSTGPDPHQVIDANLVLGRALPLVHETGERCVRCVVSRRPTDEDIVAFTARQAVGTATAN